MNKFSKKNIIKDIKKSKLTVISPLQMTAINKNDKKKRDQLQLMKFLF